MAEAPGSPPPVDRAGVIERLIAAVKGLTITNVLIIALLLVILAPGYVLYRAINDEQLLDRFLSTYRELPSGETGCVVRNARVRGGADYWGISTSFAAEGQDRYLISVQLNHEPSAKEVESYCQTLNLVVEFMRDPEAESPPFPGTDEPVVRTYEKGRSDDR